MVNIRLFVLKFMLLASIMLLCISCEEFCEESNRVALVVKFFSSESGELMNQNVVIRAFINDNDLHEILYNRANYQQVLLPLNPNSDEMKFIFIYSEFSEDPPVEFSADTIVFRYSRHNAFISAECGCVTMGKINEEPETTVNRIQRVVVARQNIKTVSYREGVINDENIKIYY